MYCRAILPSAGLGNKLFPWGRCRVYSLEHGIPMFAPRWTQLKPRRLLRRDRDSRLYWNLFRTRPRGYVHAGLGLTLRLSATPRLDEPPDLHARPSDTASPAVITFRGERDHFHQLTGCHDLLRQELVCMTRQRWTVRADQVGPVDIGIHVRRGDFVEARSPDDFVLRGAVRTPLEWFINALTIIRQVRGEAVPAVVVSDAPDDSLSDLLRMDAVRRIETGSAMGDLLLLSRAKLLLASGGSSFSAWAAYLGQMPTLAYPGQSLSWFQIAPAHGQYIGVLDQQADLPRTLREQIDALRPSKAVTR